MDKSDRVGYLDEIEFKSKNSPGFYDKKLTLTTEKTRNCIISPETKNKVVIDRSSSIGPGSYNEFEAYTS